MIKSLDDPWGKNLTPKPSGSPELKLSNMNTAMMDALKGPSVISFRSNESNRSERRSTHTSPQMKNVSLSRVIEIEDADGIVPFNQVRNWQHRNSAQVEKKGTVLISSLTNLGRDRGQAKIDKLL